MKVSRLLVFVLAIAIAVVGVVLFVGVMAWEQLEQIPTWIDLCFASFVLLFAILGFCLGERTPP